MLEILLFPFIGFVTRPRPFFPYFSKLTVLVFVCLLILVLIVLAVNPNFPSFFFPFFFKRQQEGATLGWEIKIVVLHKIN